MAHRDLCKAGLLCQLRQPFFMLWIAVGVHQNDGNRAQPAVVGVLQITLRAAFIQRLQYLTCGIDALIHFKHSFVKHFRQLDIQRKQIRTGLVANTQGILKAFADE